MWLVAHWRPVSHTVSRDDLGGSGPTGKQHTLTRQDVERAWRFPPSARGKGPNLSLDKMNPCPASVTLGIAHGVCRLPCAYQKDVR